MSTTVTGVSTALKKSANLGRKGLVALGGSFWVMDVTILRIIPVMALCFLAWNPWTWSHAVWTMERWNSNSFFYPKELQSEEGVWYILFLFCTAMLYIALWTLFSMARRGYGGHWLKVAMATTPIIMLGFLYVALGGAPSGPWFQTMVIGLVGLWLGIGFSIPMIRRKLQGVMSVSQDAPVETTPADEHH